MKKLNTLRNVSFAIIALFSVAFPIAVASANSGTVSLDATDAAKFSSPSDTATVTPTMKDDGIVRLDEVRIVVGETKATVTPKECWRHELVQGNGSVRVCGFSPGN